MDAIDHLEEYLRSSRILDICAFPATTGGAHPRKLVILEGGVGTVAKPADASSGAADMVPREVAAWVVARALGWTDMLSATVLRQIPSAQGDVDAALMVAWPTNQPDVDPGFDDDDRWRTAVFDFIIGQADRGGHNWLAVPDPAHGTARLKLVDHGHCFGYPPNSSLNSTFFNEKKGQHIPTSIMTALVGFSAQPPTATLEPLIGTTEAAEVESRVNRVLGTGVLQP